MPQKRTVMWTYRKKVSKYVKWYVVRDRFGRIVEWQRYKRCHAQDIKRKSKAEKRKKK